MVDSHVESKVLASVFYTCPMLTSEGEDVDWLDAEMYVSVLFPTVIAGQKAYLFGRVQLRDFINVKRPTTFRRLHSS
jgi:hypothetical protein